MKKIPKFEELFRNAETYHDTTGSKEIEKLSSIKNEIKKNIIKETIISAKKEAPVLEDKKIDKVKTDNKSIKIIKSDKVEEKKKSSSFN